MDSLNLKSLLEVVRTGSFSKAAENLFVTQSAVSRRIKSLEEEYGCALLDRSGVTVKPTGAGRLVMAEAMKILDIEDKLLRRLDGREEDLSLSFACTHPFGICHLPNALKLYTARYPHLNNLKMSFVMPDKALQGLQEETYDLIVIEHWELLDLSGYLALSLPEDEMIFVSSPRLGLSTPMVTIDELVKQRLYRRKNECCSWKYLRLNMQIAGREITEFTDTVVYDDLHVIMQSVGDGDGIALMSRDLAQPLMTEGKLCGHRVEGFNHRRKRSLVMRRQARLGPAAEFFIASIFSSFGQPAPELNSISS